MSGILDSKSRVLDTIVTFEGRRQMASAGFVVQYVSFTDVMTHYRPDLVSGSADATTRIYLESCNLPQDQITFEADDSGRLQPFSNSNNLTVKDGKILAYSFDALTASVLTGSNQNVSFESGDAFASSVASLFESSIENFGKLRLIGTKDRIFEDDGFAAGNSRIQFSLTDDRPLPDRANWTANINNLESLFQDIRLSKLKNFKYLPPINKPTSPIDTSKHSETWRLQLGEYKPWGNTAELTPKQLEHELSHFESIGFSKQVVFEPTSRDNNIVGQFFEVNKDQVRKLDVIDYGTYVWKGKQRRAFFVGRVFVDDNDTQTFVHLFTLVFG